MDTNTNIKNKIIRVAICETNVLGVKAYHARCFNCGWQSKRKNLEITAVKIAKNHRCKIKKEIKNEHTG